MIRITDLQKSFASDFTLKIGELHIAPGDRVALVGMNGSGKSTLLRLLAGQTAPDKGELCVNVPKKEIGYLPQSPYAFRGTAAYNVRVGVRHAPDISAALAACELQALAGKKMSALSGGEKQRVYLARMLAGKYKLLLLDEPLSAADLKTGALLSERLGAYCENNGVTLVFSTHLPKHAFDMANKIVLLDGGEIAEQGGTARMRTPQSAFGKLFFSQWEV